MRRLRGSGGTWYHSHRWSCEALALVTNQRFGHYTEFNYVRKRCMFCQRRNWGVLVAMPLISGTYFSYTTHSSSPVSMECLDLRTSQNKSILIITLIIWKVLHCWPMSCIIIFAFRLVMATHEHVQYIIDAKGWISLLAMQNQGQRQKWPCFSSTHHLYCPENSSSHRLVQSGQTRTKSLPSASLAL